MQSRSLTTVVSIGFKILAFSRHATIFPDQLSDCQLPKTTRLYAVTYILTILLLKRNCSDCLLARQIVLSCRQTSKFRRNMLLPSSELRNSLDYAGTLEGEWP
jgi:hypothetical protein